MALTILQKNIIFNMIGQVTVSVLGFLSFKYIYSLLGDDALGLIYFSLMLSTALTSALDMGLSRTIIREVSAHHGCSPHYVKKLTQTFSLFYSLAYGLMAFFFVLFLPTIVDSWIKLSIMNKELASKVLYIIGVTSLLMIPKAFFSSICIGMQRMDINNSIEIFITALQQLGMVLLLIEGSDVIVVAYWLASTNIFRIILYAVIVSRLLSIKHLLPRFSAEVLTRVKVYTTKMMWISLLLVVHKQLDKVLISKFLPIGILGVYSFTYTSISKTTLITGSVAQAVFPVFSELEAKKEHKKLINNYFTLQNLIVFGTVPIFALATFFTIPLFTFLLDAQKAKMLQLPILLLVISFYLNATLRILSTYVSATGRPEYIIKSNVLALFCVTPLTVLLIGKLGILGATISWIAYYIIGALYLVPLVYRREFDRSPFVWLKPILTVILGVCLTYIPAWNASRLFFSDSLFVQFALFVLSTILYGVFAINMSGKGVQKLILDNIPYAKIFMFSCCKG